MGSQIALLSDLISLEAREAERVIVALGDPRLYARLKTRMAGSHSRVDWRWFQSLGNERHQEMLAELFLVNAISIYEEWTSSLKAWLPYTLNGLAVAVEQQPDHPANGGIEAWLDSKKASRSQLLAETVQVALATDSNFDENATPAKRVAWYRAWKELRNFLVHGNGTDSTRLRSAIDFAAELPVDSIKSAQYWRPEDWIAGGQVCVSPFEVVGLLELLQSLVRTVDVACAGLIQAEDVLRGYWREGEASTDSDAIKAANTLVGSDNLSRQTRDRVGFLNTAFGTDLLAAMNCRVEAETLDPDHVLRQLVAFLPPTRGARAGAMARTPDRAHRAL